MDIIITGLHLDITDPVRDYANEKAGKLSRYCDRVAKVEVLIGREDNHTYDVEMIAHVDGHDHFVAHGKHEDVNFAIDDAESKMERQLRDHKDKLVHRHRG